MTDTDRGAVLDRINTMTDREVVRFAIWCAGVDPARVAELLDQYEADQAATQGR